ncbi:ABC transporter ATP-binding protein [Chloroflexota bacterium]
MALIETINLCQRHGGQETLRNINISIDRGEVFALIGPTGAGKTTLLRLIDLIDLPSSGKISLDGQDAAAASPNARLAMRRRMAFVLQKPAVFNASVYDNIAFGLKCRGMARNESRRQVNSVLDMVGLADYQYRNARTLSGGEAQRVAIGRALAIKPEILLLDEPTANLDPRSAAAVEDLLVNIIKQSVTTVIMSTHDMSQGQRLADRIAVLIDGTIQQKGTYGEVFTRPGSRDVAEFVGVENIIDGVITANAESAVTIAVNNEVIEAVADIAEGQTISVCIRPEDVTLSLDKSASSARNCFSGEVERAVAIGPLARVEINCGFRLVTLVTKKSAEELSLIPGKKVYATFKATAAHVIRRH